MKPTYFTLGLLIPLHILSIIAICTLVFGYVSPVWLVASFLGWIIIVGLGTAIGFHKLLSHRSFEANIWVTRALTYFGCLGLTGSPLYYVSIHQGYHHPFSDKEGDLHSPRDGFWHAYMGWQLKITSKDIDTRFGRRLLSDPFQRFVNKYYLWVAWGSFILLCAVDFRLGLFGMILPAAFGFHIENTVTSFGHKRWFGYRNYDLPDDSVNNWLLGLFSWGNGLQNNHHQLPNNYNMAHRWFEVDLSVPLIAVLRRIP